MGQGALKASAVIFAERGAVAERELEMLLVMHARLEKLCFSYLSTRICTAKGSAGTLFAFQ